MSNILQTDAGVSTTLAPQSSAAAPTSPESTRRDVAGWANRAVHTVHLPSGMVVRFRLPDLAALLARGQVPEELRQIALEEVLKEDDASEKPIGARVKEDGTPYIDQKAIQDFYELRKMLILLSVVEPQLSAEDLPLLPTEDMDLLQALATRQRYTDARGVALGVEPLSRWATFCEAHRCPSRCEACARALAALSTVDVPAV